MAGHKNGTAVARYRCGLFQAPIIKNLFAIWGSKLLYGAYATGQTAGSPYGALYQNTFL